MELKHTTKIVYRIEPKPDGGFIARSVDPSVEPLEALTLQELQKKIQAMVFGNLAAVSQGLNLLLGNKQSTLNVQVGRTPETNVTFHTSGANASHDMAALLRENFPDVAQVLSEQNASGQGFGNLPNQDNVAVNVTSLKFDVTEAFRPTGTNPTVGTGTGAGMDVTVPNANIPNNPESGSNWKILRFLVFLLIIAAVIYLFRTR